MSVWEQKTGDLSGLAGRNASPGYSGKGTMLQPSSEETAGEAWLLTQNLKV